MTEYIFEVEINDLDQNQNIKKTDSSINTISFEILMKNTKNIFKKIYTSMSGFKINQEDGIITSNSDVISYQNIDDTCYSDNIVPLRVEECISIVNKENTVEDNSLIISPNPAKDYVKLTTEKIKGNYEVTLLNVVGEIVFKTKNQNELNVSFLSKGLYFIQVTDERKFIYTQKMVIQ